MPITLEEVEQAGRTVTGLRAHRRDLAQREAGCAEDYRYVCEQLDLTDAALAQALEHYGNLLVAYYAQQDTED